MFTCDDCGEEKPDDVKRIHLPTGFDPATDDERTVCLTCSVKRPSANIYRPVSNGGAGR